MYNKEYWEQLFSNRKSIIPYEPFLDEFRWFFKAKIILDVGAGDGRNCFYFSELGFDLSCIDFSSNGLNEIARKAKNRNIIINTHCYDIELDNIEIEKSFDVICFIHINTSIDILRKFAPLLNNDGIILIMTFLKDSVAINSAKYNVGIERKDIEIMKTEYENVEEKIFEDNRGKQIGLVFKKKKHLTNASS